MHPWCSFCLSAMFVITVCESLIVRISYASMMLIMLLCHVCDKSEWVLDCQNSAYMHGAHSASVPCLWSKRVSAWLSESHVHAWCSFYFYAMFVIKASECLIVRILHAYMVFILLLCHVCDQSLWVSDCQNSACMHGAHSTSVLCLWSQQVSAWLSEFQMYAWCSFCFCVMFVIKGCECLIVRIPHTSMVLILLLCHICDQSEWVFDCQISTCIPSAHSVSVPCLWSQYVSAWLSEFHMHAQCSFCFCAMFVITGCELDCQNSTSTHGAHYASVPCSWSKRVSAWLSDFHVHPSCSLCIASVPCFVVIACECLIVTIPHASMVLILLLCHVCDYRKWVLDC